jgi:hypothetical protein
VLIPKLVNIIVIILRNFLNGVAGSVATAHAVLADWARCTLARGSFIPREAFASTNLAIAKTLVGAFHVVMSRVH